SIRPGAHVAATVALSSLTGGGEDFAVGGDLAGSDGGGGGDLATLDLAGLAPRYVFLLPLHASNLGVQSGLDVECAQSAAAAARPPPGYRAVIPYPTPTPRTALDLPAGRAIVLPDGTQVATDATFFQSSHLAPIDELASGAVAHGCVFTDFNPNGDKIQAAA